MDRGDYRFNLNQAIAYNPIGRAASKSIVKKTVIINLAEIFFFIHRARYRFLLMSSLHMLN